MSVPVTSTDRTTITINPSSESAATLAAIMETMAGTIGVLSALLASPDLPPSLRVVWGSQIEMRRDHLQQEREQLQRCILTIARESGKGRPA